MDATFLSRIQFAITVGFHILWPMFTIGMGFLLVILEALWLKTKDKKYLSIYKFWCKLFALAFGIGVASGIPMAFQFGTNWSTFYEKASAAMGPLLGTEVLTAFFLEAVFIGVMLFGWKKVHPVVHFLATILVCLGTHNSALWIIIANSWMQTPAGVEMIDGVIKVTSWKEVIFNPSMPCRLVHKLLACYLSATMLGLGTSAFLLLRDATNEIAQKAFKFFATMLIILSPIQILAGDAHGLNTLEYQPAKVAAMEGNWETQKGIPLILFALPDSENEKNRFEIGIPKFSSLILTHHLDGEVVGLKDFAKEDRPHVPTVFWSFRVMVGIGLLMFAVAIWSLILMFKKKLFTAKSTKLLQKLAVVMIPSGFIAGIAGWLVTEIGRQPWIVYGLIKIKDGSSPVAAGSVLFSIIMFSLIYMVLFAFWFYYSSRLAKKGYDPVDTVEVYGDKKTASLPN